MATPSSARRKQPSAPPKSQRDAPAVTEAHAATLEPPSATRTSGAQRLGSSPSSRQRSSSRGNSRSGSGSNSRRASLSAGGLRAPTGSGVASAGRRGGRSRAGSVHVADAAAAAAVAASAAAAAAAAATSLAPAAPRFPPSPRLSAPPALASALVDSSNWPYRIGAPAAQIHVDPALSTTALTLVTCPRRKQTLLVNNIATVRQMYQHVKFVSGVNEPFDLLFGYPSRVLGPPEATLADLGVDRAALLQRLHSDMPAASSIGRGGGGGAALANSTTTAAAIRLAAAERNASLKRAASSNAIPAPSELPS